jgi:hypothetical protein
LIKLEYELAELSKACCRFGQLEQS